MSAKKNIGINSAMIGTIEEARTLFVYEGYNRKEIAHKLKINPKTVGKWVIAFGWQHQYNMGRKQLEKFIDAKYLFLYDGLTRKAIAIKLELNIKTVCVWVKKYEWDTIVRGKLSQPRKEITVHGFLKYIEKENTKHYNVVNMLFLKYCSTL